MDESESRIHVARSTKRNRSDSMLYGDSRAFARICPFSLLIANRKVDEADWITLGVIVKRLGGGFVPTTGTTDLNFYYMALLPGSKDAIRPSEPTERSKISIDSGSICSYFLATASLSDSSPYTLITL